MRRAAILLAWVALAALAPGVPAAEPAEPDSGARAISLAEALALARQNAPQAVQAAGQVRSGRAAIRSAYAAFIPNLSLSMGTSRQYTGVGATRIENGTVVQLANRPWSYNAGLSASVSLFEGGRRFLDLRQANAGLAAAEASQVSQRYLVDLDVKQQYFNVLAARESEVAARAQLEQAQQQLRTSVLRLRAASATKSDSLRSAIQVRNARLAVLQARTDLETANVALARAIGVSYAVTASPSDSAGAEEIGFDEAALGDLAAAGPAVQEAEAQLRAARAAKTSAWTYYLPSLTASYSRGGSGSGQDFAFGNNDLSYNGSLRFSLSFPLFNQLGREEQVVRNDVAAENAEASLRDARLSARENLTRYFGAFQTAEERVQTQTTTVAAAEEDLRVQQQRYALGESTVLDVLTSQTQLNEARAALIRARYDQRIARAQLEALVGRDL